MLDLGPAQHHLAAMRLDHDQRHRAGQILPLHRDALRSVGHHHLGRDDAGHLRLRQRRAHGEPERLAPPAIRVEDHQLVAALRGQRHKHFQRVLALGQHQARRARIVPAIRQCQRHPRPAQELPAAHRHHLQQPRGGQRPGNPRHHRRGRPQPNRERIRLRPRVVRIVHCQCINALPRQGQLRLKRIRRHVPDRKPAIDHLPRHRRRRQRQAQARAQPAAVEGHPLQRLRRRKRPGQARRHHRLRRVRHRQAQHRRGPARRHHLELIGPHARELQPHRCRGGRLHDESPGRHSGALARRVGEQPRHAGGQTAALERHRLRIPSARLQSRRVA